MPILNRITGIEGLSAGGGVTVTGNLPVDRRYLGLKFFTTINGVAAAVTDVVDRVRLHVNGRSIWDVSAAPLLALMKLHGITPATGELPIYFAEPARADKTDEIVTAWDLRGESTFQVQFVLKTLAQPTDVPGINGLAIFDYGTTMINGRPAKLVTRLLEIVKSAASGQNVEKYGRRCPARESVAEPFHRIRPPPGRPADGGRQGRELSGGRGRCWPVGRHVQQPPDDVRVLRDLASVNPDNLAEFQLALLPSPIPVRSDDPRTPAGLCRPLGRLRAVRTGKLPKRVFCTAWGVLIVPISSQSRDRNICTGLADPFEAPID